MMPCPWHYPLPWAPVGMKSPLEEGRRFVSSFCTIFMGETKCGERVCVHVYVSARSQWESHPRLAAESSAQLFYLPRGEVSGFREEDVASEEDSSDHSFDAAAPGDVVLQEREGEQGQGQGQEQGQQEEKEEA